MEQQQQTKSICLFNLYSIQFGILITQLVLTINMCIKENYKKGEGKSSRHQGWAK